MVGDMLPGAKPIPLLFLVLTCLLSLSSMPRATASSQVRRLEQDQRAGSQFIRDYRKLRKEDGSNQALLALRNLSVFDTPAVAEVALDELANDEVEFHGAARGLIQSFQEPASLAWVVDEGLGHRDAAVRAQVLLALAQGRPEAIDWLTPTEAALDDREPVVRAAAVEALGLARANARLERILELTSDDSVRVRQRIPEALVRLANQRALAPLRTLATDPSWRVRSATVRALGQLRNRAGVAELVDVLAREEGRVREDALRELQRVTRMDFGVDADKWQRYVRSAPEDFLDADAPGAAFRTTAPGHVEYYGLSTLSRRLVIITDCSSSMRTRVPLPERPADSEETVSRLDLTKMQITSLLESVDAEVALNLVTFSLDVKRWQSSLRRMDARGRQSALSEVRQYHPAKSTNVYAALEACLDMAQVSLDDPRKEDKCPDTLFLLTDGQPSAGRITGTEALLAYVAERNRDLDVRIHCVDLSTRGGGALLRALAELTTGDSTQPVH